jgi:hypothetical protein
MNVTKFVRCTKSVEEKDNKETESKPEKRQRKDSFFRSLTTTHLPSDLSKVKSH